MSNINAPKIKLIQAVNQAIFFLFLACLLKHLPALNMHLEPTWHSKKNSNKHDAVGQKHRVYGQMAANYCAEEGSLPAA